MDSGTDVKSSALLAADRFAFWLPFEVLFGSGKGTQREGLDTSTGLQANQVLRIEPHAQLLIAVQPHLVPMGCLATSTHLVKTLHPPGSAVPTHLGDRAHWECVHWSPVHW